MAGPERIELSVRVLETRGLPLTDGPKSLQLFLLSVYRVLAAIPTVFFQFQLFF